MADQVYGPNPRALEIVAEFTKLSSVSLSTPESMTLAYLISGELRTDAVRIDTLGGGLDTAIKCGDAQREKIKDLEKYRTNLIRALGSVMHECSAISGCSAEGSRLKEAIKKVVMNVLAPDTCQKCYQRESEFDAGPGVPVCKECWVDWWVDGLEPRDDEHRAELKKETMENMDKQERLEAADG